ncbi:BTB/POZ protein [Penicillium nucicola]|uniref:BTB/POZ protein n=1 Tax=Penicillium nucicola TaxID=1850975 RepID=UPI0025454975|nr:BTB/POZ protein [Penicillium nucicola]KAJ5757724.1 BTB/POZ protein [Penicillium nucicola]
MSELQDVMRDLLLQSQFSDMKILCQGTTFKVHQAIVCTQSSYFYSAMCDGFKESTEKAINIQDDNPETIERVLSFLYLRDYSEDGHIFQYQPISELANKESDSSLSVNKPENTEPENIEPENIEPENIEPENIEPENIEPENQPAFDNIEVFIAADKYGIIPLKTLATSKFSRWANASYGSPVFHEVIEKVITHIFDLIKVPEIVHVLDSFGYLGSSVIARSVSTGMPSLSALLEGF